MDVFALIEAQQKGLEDTTIFMVGEQLKDICRADPASAQIVMEDLQQKEMSIAACEKKIKEHADKLKTEKKLKAVGISPKTADAIIRKFYGLPDAGAEKPAAAPAGMLDLEALLG